jgi:hypothetical protein
MAVRAASECAKIPNRSKIPNGFWERLSTFLIKPGYYPFRFLLYHYFSGTPRQPRAKKTGFPAP